MEHNFAMVAVEELLSVDLVKEQAALHSAHKAQAHAPKRRLGQIEMPMGPLECYASIGLFQVCVYQVLQ